MISYEELGIKRIINAAATLTRLGGSRMPPPVVEAMVAGARPSSICWNCRRGSARASPN